MENRYCVEREMSSILNDTQDDSRDLTTGVIWKKLVLFFLPLLAGTWFQQLYNAADAVIVGRFVGTEALAAVGGSSATIMNLLIGFFIALSNGATVVVSQLYGSRKHKEVGEAASTAVLFSTGIGIILTIVCYLLAPYFLVWLKTPADTIPGATTYLRICFSCTTFVLLLNTESGILRAAGDSRRPFFFMLVSCLTNIVLDLVFVVFFHWGVAGVAWATIISQFLNFLLVTIALVSTTETYRIVWNKLRFSRNLFGQMMHIGIPSSLETSMYNVANMVLQVAVNSLGTVVVASWSLSGKLDGFYWATSNAASMAIVAFVGQNCGAKRLDRIHDCVKTSFKLFVPVTIFLSTALLTLAPLILPLFSDDPAVVTTTYQLMKYFVPYYFIWSGIEILTGTMRGCSDVVIPVVITGVGIFLFRIIWVLTAFRAHPTLFVVSISYVISWIITVTPMFIHYKRGKWQDLAR